MADEKGFAATDRKLVKALEKATSDLIEHRWHWTLDEENGKAVSVAEYALAVGAYREDVLRCAEARNLYEREVAADENYTAVQALDSTNVGVATPR